MRTLILVLLAGMFFTASASAQRQTKLYIDDGSGHFTILQGASGGDTVTFPTAGGTLLTTGGNIVISTEVDTAKAANTVTVSGKTASATVITNGSTSDVTATVTTGVAGQVLYLFNNLGTTHNVTLNSYSISDGKIGIFIYLAGAWRSLANSAPAVF